MMSTAQIGMSTAQIGIHVAEIPLRIGSRGCFSNSVERGVGWGKSVM